MGFSRQDTCRYVRDAAAQLALLSGEAGLEVLSYTLSMAELEADNQLELMRNPPEAKLIAHGPVESRQAREEITGAFAT
jgi:hypothetical protein